MYSKTPTNFQLAIEISFAPSVLCIIGISSIFPSTGSSLLSSTFSHVCAVKTWSDMEQVLRVADISRKAGTLLACLRINWQEWERWRTSYLSHFCEFLRKQAYITIALLRYFQTENVSQNHNSIDSSVFYAPLFHIITRSANGQRTVSEWSANSLTVHLIGLTRGAWKTCFKVTW